MRTALELSNYILFVYYLLSNLIYSILLVAAIYRNTWHRHRLATFGWSGSKLHPSLLRSP
jgi:hypothetical protein